MLMSKAESPNTNPVKPPVTKVETNPIENNMAGFNCRFPFQSVVI